MRVIVGREVKKRPQRAGALPVSEGRLGPLLVGLVPRNLPSMLDSVSATLSPPVSARASVRSPPVLARAVHQPAPVSPAAAVDNAAAAASPTSGTFNASTVAETRSHATPTSAHVCRHRPAASARPLRPAQRHPRHEPRRPPQAPGPLPDRALGRGRARAVGEQRRSDFRHQTRQATTTVGPMINEAAAERAQAWVQEAATAGATTVTGGDRDRALLTPTVLANVPGDARVNRDEVFAPVLTVTAVDSEQEAFDAVNDSAFGLQAGVSPTTSPKPPRTPRAPGGRRHRR